MTTRERFVRWFRIRLARHKYAVHCGEIRVMEKHIQEHQDYLSALREITGSLQIMLMDAERDPAVRWGPPAREVVVRPRIKAKVRA